MEIQLQELLDKIKREGVDTARAESERLLAEAQETRTSLLGEAEREARAIVDKARADAALAEESGKAALAQASRDLLLAVRDSLQGLLDSLIRVETAAAFGPDVLAEALPAVLKSLAAGGTEDLAVLLPPAVLKKLDDRFTARLAAELKKGVQLRPAPDLEAGFRVVEKDGAAYFDFSADTIAALLARRLNARLAEILKTAAGTAR
jgi:V/A-type H+-transporting ATPase subunit E